jgi:RNA polymerase sigma factor for flagellar operon FliA
MAQHTDSSNALSQEIAVRMMPRIRRIAGQLARRLPRHIRVDDLVGAGCQGLCTALARLDPQRVEGFESYAELRIRGAMLDELRACDPLSRDQRARAKRIATTRRTLEARLGRAPSCEEMARELGVSLETYFAWQFASASPVAAGATGEDADPIADLSDPRAEAADERLEKSRKEQSMQAAMAALPPRLARVLEMHYVDGLTLREIGRELGVTESRVCQLESDALRRLRERCKEPAELTFSAAA